MAPCHALLGCLLVAAIAVVGAQPLTPTSPRPGTTRQGFVPGTSPGAGPLNGNPFGVVPGLPGGVPSGVPSGIPPSGIPSIPGLPNLPGGGGNQVNPGTPVNPNPSNGCSATCTNTPGCSGCAVRVTRNGVDVCVDQFEYPNQPCVQPVGCMTIFDAENLCKEKGKRLCTPKEWETACRGPQNTEYVYGPTKKMDVCWHNKAKYLAPNWGKLAKAKPHPTVASIGADTTGECARLLAPDRVKPAGAMSGCRTPDGLYDMNGNLFEFVDNGPKKNNLRGGFFIQCTNNSPKTFPSCSISCGNGAHGRGFRSYEWGVRCCSNPTGGAPAIPAAPGALPGGFPGGNPGGVPGGLPGGRPNFPGVLPGGNVLA